MTNQTRTEGTAPTNPADAKPANPQPASVKPTQANGQRAEAVAPGHFRQEPAAPGEQGRVVSDPVPAGIKAASEDKGPRTK